MDEGCVRAIDDERQFETLCSTSFLTRPRSLLFGNQPGAGPEQKPLARVVASIQLPLNTFLKPNLSVTHELNFQNGKCFNIFKLFLGSS